MTKLKLLRDELGITQYEAAAKIGINAPFLSMIEKGRLTSVPKHVEDKLVAFFGKEWTFAKLTEEVKAREVTNE